MKPTILIAYSLKILNKYKYKDLLKFMSLTRGSKVNETQDKEFYVFLQK